MNGVDVARLEDAEIMERLTAIRGVGLWSVQMYLMFKLKRPNVLPTGDLGVRKGVSLLRSLPGKGLEGLSGKARVEKMEKLCEVWKPYQSVASVYCWRHVDGAGR